MAALSPRPLTDQVRDEWVYDLIPLDAREREKAVRDLVKHYEKGAVADILRRVRKGGPS